MLSSRRAGYGRVVKARFRLLSMVDRVPRVAEVEVQVKRADRDEVVVSADAFAWRLDDYGPTALVDMLGDDELVTEAIDGVRHGLDRLGRRDIGYLLTVTRVWPSPVDTGPGDVKAAATQALYLALGVQPEPAPRGRTIV
jgi:hypothetical protein